MTSWRTLFELQIEGIIGALKYLLTLCAIGVAFALIIGIIMLFVGE